MPTDEQTYSLPTTLGLAAVITVVVVGVATSLVLAADLYMILFLAFLFGIFLHRSGQIFSSLTGVPRKWSTAAVALLLILASAGGAMLFGVQVEKQLSRAREEWQEAMQQIRDIAQQRPALKSALESIPFAADIGFSKDSPPPAGDLLESQDAGQSATKSLPGVLSPWSQATSGVASALGRLFRTTFGLLVNSILIFFVGLFLAMAPEKYQQGLLKLFPRHRQQRIDEVSRRVYETLWKWLIGRFATMVVTGLGATLVLLVAGVPMAFILGIVTGLLTFVPNIGAFFAGILMILFAVPQGGSAIVLTTCGYLILQLVESYLITPLIQQRQVEIAPAALLSFQALLSVLLGFLGAAVASPLLAMSNVIAEELYIRDILEADPHTPSERPST